MSFDELQLKRIEKEFNTFREKHGPPVEIRHELDFAYKIDKLSVTIFEIRPDWRDPEKKMETPVSKVTYVKSKKIWKIYWMRQDLKWHNYEPDPEVSSFSEFLEVLGKDEFACFWG